MSLPRRVLPALCSASVALMTMGTFMALTTHPTGPPQGTTDAAARHWWTADHDPGHEGATHRPATDPAGPPAFDLAAPAPLPAGPRVPAAVPPVTGSTSTPSASATRHADRAKRPTGTTAPSPSSGRTTAPAPTAPAPAPTAPAPGPAAPPAVAGSSSGIAAPNGDLPGWHLVLSEDFTRPAALGQFASAYPGWAGYDGAHDTSGHGTYDSATTTSVSGGVLDENIGTVGSRPTVMALTPPAGGSHQTYGRYAVRFRADALPGYKIAWLLWPTDDNWSEGELDFPEADLAGQIEGYAHDTTGSPERNAWAVDSGTAMGGWHTAVLEWSATGLTYTLDGRSWHTSNTDAIPRQAMNWVLQTETAENGSAPASAVSGHIDIDWVAAWTAA